MSDSQNELIKSQRTDGICAVCNGQKKILTEVTVRDPHDAHGNVVDTASSGTEAFKKVEKIEEIAPGGKPYEIQ